MFYTKILENARPAFWAADDLKVEITVGNESPESGLENVNEFVQTSILSSGECASHLVALRDLNNALRKHCYDALVTYLTQLNRVEQSDSTPVTTPRQLRGLFLQDIEADVEESTIRIPDATSPVQKFVQSACIGLEPKFTVTQEFSRLWECKFASFETWVVQARRHLYDENWVQWEELKTLHKGSEADSFLLEELSTEVENLLKPGRPLSMTAGLESPREKGPEPVQSNKGVVFNQHTESTPENLLVLGTPDRHARQTLLAVSVQATCSNGNSTSKATTVSTSVDNN